MRHKFHTIQYLRGFAAMLVLASHALLYPLVEHDRGFGRLGWMGVILFFVISGFIMVAVTGEGRFSATDFLRRRVIRVVPLYWMATLLAAALALLAPHLFKTTVYDGTQLVLSLLFVPFHNAASGGIHPLYKLGWTLNYEMFFYVCFALLAFLGMGARVVWLTLAFGGLMLLGLLLQPQAAIPQFYTSFIPMAFCAGAWLGLATVRGTLMRLSPPVLYAAAAIGLAGLVQGFAWGQGPLVEDGIAFIGLLLFASSLVLLAVHFDARLRPIALLERIGDASYSIYLSHIYVVAILCDVAFRFFDRGDMVADYLVAILAIVVGVAVGWVLYSAVERPVLRRVTGIFGGKRKPLVAAPAE